jgi:hypothetical protein
MDWHLSPYLKPLPAPGLYFKRESMARFVKLPGKQRTYSGSWYELDEAKAAGAMCHIVAELDLKRVLRVVEVWHKRATVYSAVEAMAMIDVGFQELAEIKGHRRPEGVLTWFHEPGQVVSAVAPALDSWRRSVPDGPVLPVRPLREPLDLRAGARLVQGEFSNGKLVLPLWAPWMADLQAELCLWPAVPSQSQVGALAVLAAGLREMASPEKKSRFRREEGTAWAA